MNIENAMVLSFRMIYDFWVLKFMIFVACGSRTRSWSCERGASSNKLTTLVACESKCRSWSSERAASSNNTSSSTAENDYLVSNTNSNTPGALIKYGFA